MVSIPQVQLVSVDCPVSDIKIFFHMVNKLYFLDIGIPDPFSVMLILIGNITDMAYS